MVNLLDEPSFDLDDCLTSTELQNSARAAYVELIKNQTSLANYNQLLGLESPSITLLAGIMNSKRVPPYPFCLVHIL